MKPKPNEDDHVYNAFSAIKWSLEDIGRFTSVEEYDDFDRLVQGQASTYAMDSYPRKILLDFARYARSQRRALEDQILGEEQ